MAQLLRFLYTDERHKPEIFTFLLPSQFILDSENELKSRDFLSCNQKWCILFNKLDGSLSCSLILKSACNCMQVTADFGIILINREHFTKNEQFIEKTAKFTPECIQREKKSFVSIENLCTLDFMDERGNIQCEVEIKNVQSSFYYDVQVPIIPQYNVNLAETKYKSDIFLFGNYEWIISIQPKLDSVGCIAALKFYLVRVSSLDHLCRISYRFKLTNGSFVHESPLIDQYSDTQGQSNSFRFDKMKELLQSTGKFRVQIDLFKVNSVFPVILYPLIIQEPQQIPVQFFDRDKQTWSMESCIEDTCLLLRLYYKDINNIPFGFLRLISFNISIRHTQLGSVYVFKKPVIKYYYKREIDEGLEISTTIDVNEIVSPQGGYLQSDGSIIVDMEWNYSHLLHQPEYSHLDDIIRKQKIQMMREIQTLQQENQSLEKQLHTAKQSLEAANINSNSNNLNSNRPKSNENGPTSTVPNLTSILGFASSAPTTPNIVKKYMESKYGSNNNTPTSNKTPNATTVNQNGQSNNNLNNSSSNNSSITNLTSQLSTGLANLKISNTLTSKFMNRFS